MMISFSENRVILWNPYFLQITARFQQESGAISPQLDKPEQGIEMIEDVLKELALTERFAIMLNVAAQELFDYVCLLFSMLADSFFTNETVMHI